MICLGFGHFNSCRGDVIEIIFDMGRQLDFIEWEILIIFTGSHKGQVWFIESTGNKVWFLTLFRKSFHAVINRMPIHNVFIL